MEINSLRSAFERSERPSRLDVFLRPDTDTEVVRTRLSRTLGPEVQVEPPWMRSRVIEKMIEGIQLTLSMLGFVALLVLITYIFLRFSLPEQTGWTVSYVFPTTGVILSLVAAFIIVAIGSIVPMRELSRFPIAKLIRYEP